MHIFRLRPKCLQATMKLKKGKKMGRFSKIYLVLVFFCICESIYYIKKKESL